MRTRISDCVSATVKLSFGLLVVFWVPGCNQFTPTGTDGLNNIVLPPPVYITAHIGDAVIEITWSYDDTASISGFRLYRQQAGEAAPRQLATVSGFRYVDRQVSNGVAYQYALAALNEDGIEGERSLPITATPGVFSVLINNGTEYTNNRLVSLGLTAPQNTTLMKIANDSTFSAAAWETFMPGRTWELPFGDGKKTVFVKFRNQADQESLHLAYDDIILDTKASIIRVEENSNGAVLKPAMVLHLRMVTDEPKGRAAIDIVDPMKTDESGRELNIRLYDDGTHGDAVADDGTYEVDYTIRPGLEVQHAFVYGHFTDIAGNQAARATATTRVSIQSPPQSVTLHKPIQIDGNATALKLTWTPNTDPDFASYKLFRSTNPGVSLISTLVAELTIQQTLEYTDANLQPNTPYYFRIYVFDQAGNRTGSNEVEGTTPENTPPEAVTLSQPIDDGEALMLSWTTSQDNDFADYRLFRSTSSPVDTTVAPLVILSSRNVTQYRDVSARNGTTYFYRIFVFDRFGLSAGSNEVQGQRNP